MQPDSTVAEQLDGVPVFAINLKEDEKLYGNEDGETMIYTGLADANRVLAQIQTAYPSTVLELLPLPLGQVLTRAGLLARQPADGPLVEEPLPALRTLIVASPDEKRAARRLREDAATPRPRPRPGAAGKLQAVPIFHLGSFESPSEGQEAFWPFFFRMADVDALWKQLGEGRERPAVVSTDLAALVDGLRQADEAPAAPMICAPLDALEYVRGRDRSAAARQAPEDLLE